MTHLVNKMNGIETSKCIDMKAKERETQENRELIRQLIIRGE